MDETELVVPWEKQQRLLHPSDSQSNSPVRKSYSYAGVQRNSNQNQASQSMYNEAVAAISAPLSRLHPSGINPQPSISEEPSVLGGSLGTLSGAARKGSNVSDPMAIIFQAGAKMKFVPFFARQGPPQIGQSSGSLSSGEISCSFIRSVD
ncbi:unnamed protein product [Hymenolepis diminuta]|uniref:ZM domain-containing protein n=1 Tax=Hymenolepis diminuta TaxID=6216 RepID=A0A0R3S9M6_HYMDI|nr:unnamed protein product [Hymenolepis diminuta]